MLSLTYWYTALGLWCTAGIIWLTLYTHFLITHVQPVVVLWISALLLGLGYGAVTCLSRFGTVAVTFDIYCHHYAYRRVISLPFLRWRDHFRDCWNHV